MTSVQCLNATGHVLHSHNSTAPNATGWTVNNYAEQTVDGLSVNCVGCEGSTPTEIVEEMEAAQIEQQQRLERQMKELDDNMRRMANELSHMHENLFRDW